MTDTDMPADATSQDALVEETPTDYPDDQPAEHPFDASYVPPDGFDEGLEVTT